MFCENCGSEFQVLNQKFCPKCGILVQKKRELDQMAKDITSLNPSALKALITFVTELVDGFSQEKRAKEIESIKFIIPSDWSEKEFEEEAERLGWKVDYLKAHLRKEERIKKVLERLEEKP